MGDSLDLPRSHPRLTTANHMNRVVKSGRTIPDPLTTRL
jgi:hypothetical protein